MAKVTVEIDVHETYLHQAQTVVRHLIEAINLVQTSPWGIELELRNLSVTDD